MTVNKGHKGQVRSWTSCAKRAGCLRCYCFRGPPRAGAWSQLPRSSIWSEVLGKAGQAACWQVRDVDKSMGPGVWVTSTVVPQAEIRQLQVEVELVPQMGAVPSSEGEGLHAHSPRPCPLVVHQYSEGRGLKERKGNSVASFLSSILTFSLGPSLSAGVHTYPHPTPTPTS